MRGNLDAPLENQRRATSSQTIHGLFPSVGLCHFWRTSSSAADANDEVLTVVCSVAAIVSITLIIVVAILAATGIVSVSIRRKPALPPRLALNASARHAVDEDVNDPDSAKIPHPSKTSSSTATSVRPDVQQHSPQNYRRRFGQ
ncbi:uncharacterized protein LOC119393160 [Rhipicephalus sanguineus]|uniref:uncharacterized protein LOC119393160 n=1 Tax=Rhipicephalus sanguineus TaxID=34632 RepID=UPI00189611C0|nr:uncharacterized protein LOC119393160 [Rhipicephalus sanguineus]